MQLGTAIVQMSARQPAATAMAAMTMDHLSGGRFILGLGVSGPQVVEGWYGDAVRQAARAHARVHRRSCATSGRARARSPTTARTTRCRCPDGTGLGKPLKSLDPPAARGHPDLPRRRGAEEHRARAELCDGWLAMLFSPDARGASTATRSRRASPATGARRSADDFEVAATVPLIVTDDVDAAADALRPFYALYFGGMGAKGTNFHANVADPHGLRGRGRRDPGPLPRAARRTRRRRRSRAS